MNPTGDRGPGGRGPGGPAPSTFNPRRLLIAASLLILVSTALLFFGRDVVREVVVIPLSYLLWGFRILVQTTPQIFFWVAVVLVAGLVAYHSLSDRRKPAASGPAFNPGLPNGDDRPGFTSGRAVFWANKANLLASGQDGYAGGFSVSNSHAAVLRLLVELLAYRYRLPAHTIEEQARAGSLGTLGVPSIPPQVLRYLQAHLTRGEPPPVSRWALAWRSLVEGARWLWRKLAGNAARPRTDSLGAELDFILTYMEKELDVHTRPE